MEKQTYSKNEWYSLGAGEFETICSPRITCVICYHVDVMVYYRTTAYLRSKIGLSVTLFIYSSAWVNGAFWLDKFSCQSQSGDLANPVFKKIIVSTFFTVLGLMGCVELGSNSTTGTAVRLNGAPHVSLIDFYCFRTLTENIYSCDENSELRAKNCTV